MWLAHGVGVVRPGTSVPDARVFLWRSEDAVGTPQPLGLFAQTG